MDGDLRVPSGRVRLRKRARPAGAFTLLELLVAIGLIAVLAGGIGVSLSDTRGSRLASAQQMLASLCGSARAQAALHQTEARLLVYATPPPAGESQKYLRAVQVVRAGQGDDSAWVAVGPSVQLPRGVAIVPPEAAGRLGAAAKEPAAERAVSTLFVGGLETPLPGTAFTDAPAVLFAAFGPEGTPRLPPGEPYLRLVVATTGPTGADLQFDNPAAVRGVLVRASGSIGFVDEAGGF